MLSGTLAVTSAIQGRKSSPPVARAKAKTTVGARLTTEDAGEKWARARITEHLNFFSIFLQLVSKSAIGSSATARGAPLDGSARDGPS